MKEFYYFVLNFIPAVFGHTKFIEYLVILII